MKKLMLNLFLLSIILASCDTTLTEYGSVSSERSRPKCDDIDLDLMNRISDKHDEIVKGILEVVDHSNCPDCEDEIYAAFMIEAQEYGYSERDSENLFGITSEFYQELVSNDFRLLNFEDAVNLSRQTRFYLAEIEEVTNNLDESTLYRDVANNIESIRVDLMKDDDISCYDREVIYAMLNVYLGSTKMYITEENGGLGLLPDIFTHPHEHITPREQSGYSAVQAAAAADVAGVGGYFLRLGILSALGAVPGTNAIIFGGAALVGGFSSGFAVLTHDPCP